MDKIKNDLIYGLVSTIRVYRNIIFIALNSLFIYIYMSNWRLVVKSESEEAPPTSLDT